MIFSRLSAAIFWAIEKKGGYNKDPFFDIQPSTKGDRKTFS